MTVCSESKANSDNLIDNSFFALNLQSFVKIEESDITVDMNYGN